MSVYNGIWYDHTINKLILTLNPTAAGFLTAAVVTWVNLVAASTWPVCRFLLYLPRQNVLINDVFHHQRQVMLRNSSSAATTAGQLISMSWKWGQYGVQAFKRSVVYLVVCVVIFATWTICGLYAPYIYTHTTSDVLLAQSPYCGWLDESATSSDPDVFNLFVAETTERMEAANIYVQQCYRNSNATSRCKDYPRQSLQFQMSDGSCPFGSQGEVCITANSTALTLDTGYLDSSRDFGLNSAPSDTVQYRRVTTCSPIHSTNYFFQINTTGTVFEESYAPEERLLRFVFGPFNYENYTYQYQVLQQIYPLAYTVDSRFYTPAVSAQDGGWVPNATFFDAEQNTGDVSIFFLSGNNMKYREPVFDPWFTAGIDPDDSVSIIFNATTNVTMYFSSYAVNALACHELHQLCIAGSEIDCTPLTSGDALLNGTQQLKGLNNAHIATAGVIALARIGTDMAAIVTSLGSSALLASHTTDGGDAQLSIFGKEQWRKEMANMFSIGLARLQSEVLFYATGPTNTRLYSLVEPPGQDSKEYICSRQRVRDPQGNVNFDMTGLIILAIGGVVLMVLGLSFEELLAWFAMRSSKLSTGHAKWLAEGIFHLHKKTLEARGIQDWQKITSTMPRSMQGVDIEAQENQENENEQTVSFLRGRKASS